jgi:FkbM family methyltransferase
MELSARTAVRSLIARLPRRVLYEAFYQSARALDVTGYQVAGAEGRFFGSLYDQGVMRRYLDTRSWSTVTVGLIRAYFGDAGGTFYDVGANIGLVSIPVARDPSIRVVAFEPDPQNCELLRANVAVADVPVEVVDAAVMDMSGIVDLARNRHNSGDHRLDRAGSAHCISDGAETARVADTRPVVPGPASCRAMPHPHRSPSESGTEPTPGMAGPTGAGASKGERVRVRAVRLDSYPPPPGRFAVKIDTQGAEPLIIAGGEMVLSQAGLIVAEFWPWGMRRMGLTAEPVLAFAAKHFQRGQVLRHDQTPSEPTPIGDVVASLRDFARLGDEHQFVDLVLSR